MIIPDKTEIESLGEEFETKTPVEVLTYALEKFGERISLASSFGAEDVVLIQMLSTIRPNARVFVLDTGYLFKETLELIETLQEKYSFRLDRYTPKLSIEDMEKKYGKNLNKIDPGTCCEIRKIEPLTRALTGLDAWITGIRRDQTPQRASAKKIEFDPKFQMVKCNPIADWSAQQVWAYIREHGIPYNPLHDKNYPSIGCDPCTMKVEEGADPRSGRWEGSVKTECGLHEV